MLIVLKIPVVYLCAVVWWAIRAEPEPLEGALRPARLTPPPPGCDWSARRRRLRQRGALPRGGRPAVGPARVALARARVGA